MIVQTGCTSQMLYKFTNIFNRLIFDQVIQEIKGMVVFEIHTVLHHGMMCFFLMELDVHLIQVC